MRRSDEKEMAHSSESFNTNFPIAHDLRKDRERRENKCTLATCGIWRDFPSLGGKFVGTGSLVQGLFLNFEEKIHLVTSNKVISSEDLNCYSLYFKKSRDREKKSKKLVKMASEKTIFKSGLAIVPIDPEKLGIIRQYTSGLLKHRPFTIHTVVKEYLRNDKLYCHVVEESGKSFAIRPYQVKGIADEETYVTDLNSIVIESASLCSSYRKGLGAPITITVKDEAFAVGATTLGKNEQLSFVLFSQIDRTRAISDVELNIYVDVDGLKTGEQNVQTDMLARRQEVQQPGVSAKSAKPEDALSSELYSTSSISESPQKREQWEKSEQETKIMEMAKLEGTSPLTVVPTTDHGKELEEPWGRKGELIFKVNVIETWCSAINPRGK